MAAVTFGSTSRGALISSPVAERVEEGSLEYEEAKSRRNRFVESYVTKKRAADGALPTTTDPMPL